MKTLPEEKELAKYLVDVCDDTFNDNDDNILATKECISSRTDDIVEQIFKDLTLKRKYDELMKAAVLSGRNVDVDEINCRVVVLLDKDSEKVYTGMDCTENCDNGTIIDVILPEYLNYLNPPNVPPYELKLRNNCIAMLLSKFFPRSLQWHETSKITIGK
ncbi:unnamed protein product [Macrosiphum euphorbiae]|uniref:ATP-dependent DNA helicase n=1 Tax=Macrosiphum euphorbiae TaxID=13131 RepID=A0AAV0WZ56_9HEMI|nr:unnamed protein product [Macrosiphum euphorbiae]